MPFFKYLFSLIFGFLSILEPTIPFAFVLFLAILLDCFSAFDLSRRVRRKYPEKATGKFRSSYALKMLNTFIKSFSVVVLLHYCDTLLIPMHDWHLANYGALVIAGIQIWSILENVSSENGAKWAKICQKIMINKAERHFDIDLKDCFKEEK